MKQQIQNQFEFLWGKLEIKSSPLFFDLIREAEIAGLIDKSEGGQTLKKY